MPRGICVNAPTVERMIALVREFPCVYNTNDSGYLDPVKAHSAWESIARIMKIDAMSGKLWKLKWKNLRDTYVKQRKLKEERQLAAGGNDRNLVTWRFFSLMSFLDPHLSKYERGFVIQVSSPDDLDCDVQCVNESDGATANFLNESEEMSLADRPYAELEGKAKRWISERDELYGSSQVDKKPKLVDKWTEGDGSTSEADFTGFCYRTSYDRPQAVTDKDPDLLLFESYALRMKRLSKETQSFVQLQMSQLFFNAENPDVEPISVIRLPRTTSSKSSAAQIFPADGEPPPK